MRLIGRVGIEIDHLPSGGFSPRWASFPARLHSAKSAVRGDLLVAKGDAICGQEIAEIGCSELGSPAMQSTSGVGNI
jgi:hypothetical protein